MYIRRAEFGDCSPLYQHSYLTEYTCCSLPVIAWKSEDLRFSNCAKACSSGLAQAKAFRSNGGSIHGQYAYWLDAYTISSQYMSAEAQKSNGACLSSVITEYNIGLLFIELSFFSSISCLAWQKEQIKFPYADNLCGGYESLYGIQAQLNDGGMQGCADTCHWPCPHGSISACNLWYNSFLSWWWHVLYSCSDILLIVSECFNPFGSQSFYLQTVMPSFFVWGERGEMHHAPWRTIVPCMGLCCGFSVGLIALWTVCPPSYPLKPLSHTHFKHLSHYTLLEYIGIWLYMEMLNVK